MAVGGAMDRGAMLRRLTKVILAIDVDHPLRVAIDGVDAAGKTTLRNELAAALHQAGRSVLSISADGFLHPRAVRHHRGRLSAEGYFRDSVDYDTLRTQVLIPLGPGGDRRYVTGIYDLAADRVAQGNREEAPPDAVALIDGIFLLVPALRGLWDLAVFVEVNPALSLERGTARDHARMGGREAARRMYEQRYLPGQQLYFASCDPKSHAHVVIGNEEPERPVVLWRC